MTKPKLHELKTDPEVFQAVWDGVKTYEIRKDDRGFEVGDELLLRETESTGEQMRVYGFELKYTGRTKQVTVSHILRGPIYGLVDGWVVLAFTLPELAARDAANVLEGYEAGKTEIGEIMKAPLAAAQRYGLSIQDAYAKGRREALEEVNGEQDYDPGYLNDHGGGNVSWWQDYIRAEVGRANDYWRFILSREE